MVRRGMGIGPYIHLSKRSRSYEAMPTRNPVPRHGVYSSRAEDFISDRVTNAGYFSNYAMEEGYDTARKSRGRDAQLLREATDAIVLSESFATPQTSVAARRVARGRSMPPRAVSVPPRSLYPEVVLVNQPEGFRKQTTMATTTTEARSPVIVFGRPWERARSVPPAVYYRDEQRRKAQTAMADLPLYRAARAASVPPEMIAPVPRSWYMPYYERRQWPYYERSFWPYYSGRYAGRLPRDPYYMPLPTEGLRAHRTPRRYLTRGGYWPSYSSFYDLYDELPSGKRVHATGKRFEEVEEKRQGIRPRVLASPIARASLARARRSVYPYMGLTRADLDYSRDPVYGYLYAPRRGRKGDQKAAIIASRIEAESYAAPRRPRSEYAARKYRALSRDSQESVYAKPARSVGLYASNPALWWY